MEYNIKDFVERLRDRMYYRFPVEDNETNYRKHVLGNKNPKPLHIRDVAFKDNPNQIVNDNMIVFDIGNEKAEKEYPYYHILEEAPVIRKAYKGNDRTKGSQAKISDLSQRDYGIINFNGKTFSKEYEKNVRGARKSVIDNSTHYVDGKKVNINAKSYKNIHYHYIENMLSAINPILADEFNMQLGRTSSTGLAEEYLMDNYNLPSIDSDSVGDLLTQILNV